MNSIKTYMNSFGLATRTVILGLAVIFVSASIAQAATTISTNISTGGTLGVTGASTLTGAVTANGALNVIGISTFGATASTTISAAGAVSMPSTLSVTGLSSLGQASSTMLSANKAYFGATGTTTISSTGAINASSTLQVTGDLTGYGNLTFGGLSWTKNTHPTRDELVVGTAGDNAVIRVYADNANAFDVKGMSATDSASNGAVLDNFMYVSYATAFNNAYAGGTKRNRLVVGTNYDSDIQLQSPHQVRIVAADNTVTGGDTNAVTTNGVGNILMISRSDVKISPWALPEAIGNNYLIVSGVTHTVATAGNPEGSQYQAGNITLETNAGDLVAQPVQGYVQLWGNAGKRFETTGTGVTVTGALTATTYVTSPSYQVGAGTPFTGPATATPSKATLQQASYWGVVTSGGTVDVAIIAMDQVDVGRHLVFSVTAGGTNALTVSSGAGMTVAQVPAVSTKTTAEDVGDAIDCLITTTATAFCTTYAAD